MMLLEPDVALTDMVLAIECGWFAAWLPRHRSRRGGAIAFAGFFAALGTAALLGAVSHGLLPDQSTAFARAVWAGTMIAIGTAAFASWIIGARLCFSGAAARLVTAFAAV